MNKIHFKDIEVGNVICTLIPSNVRGEEGNDLLGTLEALYVRFLLLQNRIESKQPCPLQTLDVKQDTSTVLDLL